ncbi:MAG TPA: hypothetical protein VFL91_20275 [Thermomicrobiales bacterium]|nr:hypothetical protein [Thermomicrobiales bacterium]
MVVVTHLGGLPGLSPADLVRAEVAGDALTFHRGEPSLGWSHYVPLAAVTLVHLTPTGGGARLTLTLARRQGPATIALWGEPAALRALEWDLLVGRREHRGRRGEHRRPPEGG